MVSSYTYVSTANAFLLRGAELVLVDSMSESMNLDPAKVREAITDKTRAIVPVHYAGIACGMDAIMELASSYGVAVVEDAAQRPLSTYKGRALGTIGTIRSISFHESKNFTARGRGGAILINLAETIRG